jgi:hypothetical protein
MGILLKNQSLIYVTAKHVTKHEERNNMRSAVTLQGDMRNLLDGASLDLGT